MPTRNLRVLHVIARMNVGGTARYLGNLLPNLNGKGVEVLLAVGHVQQNEVEDSILEELPFRRIESMGRAISPYRDMRSLLQLKKLIREFKPDVIHSHTFKAGLLSRIIFPKIPKIHTFHGHLLTDPEFSKRQRKMIIYAEGLLAKLSKKLVVTGHQVAEDLIKFKIGTPTQYISIPGELGAMKFLSRVEARRRLAIDSNFTVIWIARMATVKQPQLFVEVAKICEGFNFIMCGDGAELKAVKAAAPVNLKVLGMVNPSEVLPAADLFVSTSANEGIPYSILEAQAAGIPVLAVDAGAISEIVHDGINGVLVGNNARDIAARLIELERNLAFRQKIGAEGLESAKSKTMHPKSAELHQKLYSEVSPNQL